MNLDGFKITAQEREQNGVVSAPDTLTGTARQNKSVFDKLIGFFADKYNLLLTSLQTFTITGEVHIASRANPHEVTKAQTGLGNADDTSDMNKPVSAAQAAAIAEAKAQATAQAISAAAGYTDGETAQLQNDILNTLIYKVLFFDPVDGTKKPLQDVLNSIAILRTMSYTWGELEQKALTWQKFEDLALTWQTINNGGW